MLRIEAERRCQGLSQVRLARLTDIDPATLCRLEAGKVFPYAGWKRRLWRVLRIPEEQLFQEVEPSGDLAGTDR